MRSENPIVLGHLAAAYIKSKARQAVYKEPILTLHKMSLNKNNAKKGNYHKRSRQSADLLHCPSSRANPSSGIVAPLQLVMKLPTPLCSMASYAQLLNTLLLSYMPISPNLKLE